MRKKLAISFSGGRTSAVMTKLCVERYSETHDIAITFANTGCEHEETLKFVDRCDKHFGWGVAWLEAVVNPQKGKGIRHKIVDFETAARSGEPFEAYIAKYGMPDRNHNHCTSRLKEDVMYSYRRELGWGRTEYYTAIGIRSDEIDRVSRKRVEKKLVYPLVDWGWTKDDVKRECATWPFDLNLKGEHYGNCTWCWKKSFRKLQTLALEEPSVFDFPARMEPVHEWTNNTGDEPRRFFRGRKSVADIKAAALAGGFELYKDAEIGEPDPELDFGSACGESCEIGADYE